MLSVTLAPYRLVFREEVGLAHKDQVVEVPIPPGSPALFFLREEGGKEGGRLFPVQASRRDPARGYLRLALAPGAALALVPAEKAGTVENAVVVEDGEHAVVRNGLFELELVAGTAAFAPDAALPLPGPVVQLRQAGGPWRGRTFLDLARAPLRREAGWLERGPVRSVYRHRIEFAGDGFHKFVATIDAGTAFARIEETFRCGPNGAADQLVWDFAGDDLPVSLDLLDPTASFRSVGLHYHYDQRHARLAHWNQFSQLHDLSDGYALRFADGGALGVVALEGGRWEGNALNHLEAWTRRWEEADPATRRLPADAKADSFPFPEEERIPARGNPVCSARFTLEGWLRRGRRLYALLPVPASALEPRQPSPSSLGEQGCSPLLGHFEEAPDRERYRAQQGLLRRVQIQHGILPLQSQLGMTFSWPTEAAWLPNALSRPGQEEALRFAQEHKPRPPAAPHDPDQIAWLGGYLEARVFGFWEGSGSAYSNCVVGRRIGPELLRAEALARAGKVDPKTLVQWRAWFAFLAYLNASENYYPGPATMAPMGDPASPEPTLAGMANQNFYTDAIGVFGYAAQAFPGHPEARAWAIRFADQWEKQLAFHVYPASGLWEESHTYYQHVLATILPILLRRKADGTDDPFASSALRRLVASALPQLTPRDAITGGHRHLVSFGDHWADAPTYRNVYAAFARAFAPHDPALAARLAWAYDEMGGAPVAHPVPPSRPDWKHGRVEGLGFFFRGIDAAGNENLLALRSGASWAHHHNDEGSFQFFAHGRAMIVDAAHGRPQERGERKVAAAGHSRAAADGPEPLNFLWRFNRGFVLDAKADGPLAHAVAGISTYAAWPRGLGPQPLPRSRRELRAVVELAPALYLVADWLDPLSRHVVRFHLAQRDPRRIAVGNDGALLCRFGGFGEKEEPVLRIVPLSGAGTPELSPDRPNDPAAVAETTTAVEYRNVAGGWSLFVVGAFPDAASPLRTSGKLASGGVELIGNGLAAIFSIEANGSLRISSGKGPNFIQIDPEFLLRRLAVK